ncbi:MAG: PadR family transcriptional regulator [Pseudonocardiaceae bacterium]
MRDLNATSAALLGLLHGGPMTGGQLVAAAADRFGSFFSVTRSQVYRELPVLAEAGLLRLGKRGARSSQQYILTVAGKRAFKSWLNSTTGSDNLRSPLILRLACAGALTPKQRANLVSAARADYLGHLDEARADARVATDPYTTAIAEFTVAHRRAMLTLLDAIPTD